MQEGGGAPVPGRAVLGAPGHRAVVHHAAAGVNLGS